MAEYRAYLVGRDGHSKQAFDLEAADDAEAINKARQYVDGHDVELWQLGRRVIQLKTDKPE
jgi:hypothetical protein